jgi:hypothetical protein
MQKTVSASDLAFLLQTHALRALEAPTTEHEGPEQYSKQIETDFLVSFCAKGIEAALKAKYPSTWFSVDIPPGTSIREREGTLLCVADLEQQLQSGEVSPVEIRRHHGEGRIDTEAYVQLTRDDELLDSDLTDERRQELLDRPVPILEGEHSDKYIQIKSTNPSTKRLHDEAHMPPGYRIPFSDNSVAIVRREIGESLIENISPVEAISENDLPSRSNRDS